MNDHASLFSTLYSILQLLKQQVYVYANHTWVNTLGSKSARFYYRWRLINLFHDPALK